jgi:hypothetical protein
MADKWHAAATASSAEILAHHAVREGLPRNLRQKARRSA